MTVYVVALTKGGTGKSSTAAELVWELRQRGRRVLAIDLDRQGNFSTRLGIPKNSPSGLVAADLLDGSPVEEVVEASPTVEGVDVARGNHDLANVASLPEVVVALRDSLPAVTGEQGRWDDVVIDTPPSGETLILAALAAADVVIAPVETKAEAYEQYDELEDLIRSRVAKRLRPGLQVDWIVPTLFKKGTGLDEVVLETLQENTGAKVTHPVRHGTVVGRAFLSRQPTGAASPRSAVAEDYRKVFEQILGPRDQPQA